MTQHPAQPPSRLFTVRIWAEPVGDRSEHRGTVRDVASGAHRSFREWSQLTSFLADRLDEHRGIKEER